MCFLFFQSEPKTITILQTPLPIFNLPQHVRNYEFFVKVHCLCAGKYKKNKNGKWARATRLLRERRYLEMYNALEMSPGTFCNGLWIDKKKRMPP